MTCPRLEMPVRLLAAAGLLAAAVGVNRCVLPARTAGDAGTHEGDAYSPASPMPPGVALSTVFLGGFRGLIADGLWIRAALLQEQGRYFELVQLAEWITALEPQYPQVWAYQAWNLAYNISVLMPDDESRWNRVNNGMELLRDRALRATGYAPEICLEIGFLFQHKIGGGADERADYLLRRWTEQMQAFIREDGTLTPADADAMRAAMNMDATTMQSMENRYGKPDWRAPASHAVYWAIKGLSQQPDAGSAVLCRRMIYQAMAALFEAGSVTEDRAGGVIVLSPSFALLPGVLHAFEAAQADDPAAVEGFANWLSRAIRLLMFYQHREEAETLFNILHSRFPSGETEAGFDAFATRRQTFLPKIINTKPTGSP